MARVYLGIMGAAWVDRARIASLRVFGPMSMLGELLGRRISMKVAVGADHAGFDMKGEIVRWLESTGHQVEDVGAHTLDPDDDYPDFAAAVAGSLLAGENEKGIIICGSGVGACITANKVKGIRACLCHDTYSARQGVEHDDMNVVCIGGRVIGIELAKAVLTAFLAAQFLPEPRFQRRLDKINRVEQNGLL